MTAPDPHATNGDAVAASSTPAANNAWITADKATIDWWYQLDQRIHVCIRMWLEGQWWQRRRAAMTDALGEVLASERRKSQEAITKLTERVIRVEAAYNFEERFAKLAGEIRRGAEVPQSELPKKIEALQSQLNELKTVIGLDVCVRELADRVGELEKTNSLEARFAMLANEVNKRESEIPQSELLIKIEALQHRFDELKKGHCAAWTSRPARQRWQATARQRIRRRSCAL
jgi:hypothetical protein